MILITHNKLKAFLQNVLKDFQAFINYYQAKIKKNSQCQLEKILDWAIYLKYI